MVPSCSATNSSCRGRKPVVQRARARQIRVQGDALARANRRFERLPDGFLVGIDSGADRELMGGHQLSPIAEPAAGVASEGAFDGALLIAL